MMQFVQQDWLPIVFIGAMLAGIWVVMGATVPGCTAVAVSTSPIAPTNTAPIAPTSTSTAVVTVSLRRPDTPGRPGRAVTNRDTNPDRDAAAPLAGVEAPGIQGAKTRPWVSPQALGCAGPGGALGWVV